MELSPKQIVAELDKYIIGQDEAKKAVAISLRNRYRRSKLSKELRDEITPKNIIMKGPTGVGKTEIARRLAKLVKAPFVKVEATKFTEVGYVGRDVESMIRDLVEAAILLVKNERMAEVRDKAEAAVNSRLTNVLFVKRRDLYAGKTDEEIKEILSKELYTDKYDDEQVEIEVAEEAKAMPLMPGMEINIGDVFGNMMPKRKKRKNMKVADAKRIMLAEESDKLIDMDNVNSEALTRAEQNGIIFIDEIDKITGKGGSGSSSPDVSREGVQRDILPIVEGSTVSTKYGPVKTDYMLFIAAGAFHMSRVEDLIPELQGRFPVTVELSSLGYEDFIKILKNTENSLIVQYKSLLGVDNINLEFKDDAIKEIARIAVLENENSENIGARRLHTILEKLLEDISFNATGDHPVINVVINKQYVEEHLAHILKEYDLKKYIL
ncbi:MAG: ATP-dependent protease ATPase subunit HslU [Clostridia bacterium]|nr:ATP-dependent protease ATPase subunit HslU [Clostridia bacterium]